MSATKGEDLKMELAIADPVCYGPSFKRTSAISLAEISEYETDSMYSLNFQIFAQEPTASYASKQASAC